MGAPSQLEKVDVGEGKKRWVKGKVKKGRVSQIRRLRRGLSSNVGEKTGEHHGAGTAGYSNQIHEMHVEGGEEENHAHAHHKIRQLEKNPRATR